MPNITLHHIYNIYKTNIRIFVITDSYTCSDGTVYTLNAL